jgi:hypothetical protein
LSPWRVSWFDSAYNWSLVISQSTPHFNHSICSCRAPSKLANFSFVGFRSLFHHSDAPLNHKGLVSFSVVVPSAIAYSSLLEHLQRCSVCDPAKISHIQVVLIYFFPTLFLFAK